MRKKGKAIPCRKNGDGNSANVQKIKVEGGPLDGLKSLTKIGRGLYLGRRPTPAGSAWTAVLEGVPTGKTLGIVPGFPPREGLPVLTEAEATRMAKAWRRGLADKYWLGEQPPTVKDAVNAFILVTAADDVRKYRDLWFRAQSIFHWFATSPFHHLAKDRFQTWIVRLLLMPSAPTEVTIPSQGRAEEILIDSPRFLHRVQAVNRVILLIRNSLDLAYSNQWVASDEAWRSLRPFGVRKDGTALLAPERARLEALMAEYRKPLSPLGLRMLYTGLCRGRDRPHDSPSHRAVEPQITTSERGALS